MPSIPLIVLTNGRRDCIARTIPSAREHLSGWDHMIIVDDSGDQEYAAWLAETFDSPPVAVLGDGAPLGYWAAMQWVWRIAREFNTGAVFFLEDDFVFHADVDLTELIGVLDSRPYLTQMSLLRQPWFANEREHGGLIEALEAQGQHFQEVSDGTHHWIEHRACFTGNPSLIPARTLARDWPSGDWSESRFGRELFADPRARGAYWGRRSEPPRVEHIGVERVGAGY